MLHVLWFFPHISARVPCEYIRVPYTSNMLEFFVNYMSTKNADIDFCLCRSKTSTTKSIALHECRKEAGIPKKWTLSDVQWVTAVINHFYIYTRKPQFVRTHSKNVT